MTEEIKEINNRIKNCVLNVVSKFINERNEYESLIQDIQNFFSNYEKDYNEYIEKMNILTTNCNDEELTSNNLQETLDEKNNEVKKSQAEFNELETKYNILFKELEKLKLECIKTKQKTELSTIDRTILDLARKRLDLYGEMTNVMWDYSVPLLSPNYSGYVRNKEKNYIHAFEFNKDNMSHSKLLETMWNEIDEGSEEAWDDIVANTDIEIVNLL